MSQIVIITNTRSDHAVGASETVRLAYNVSLDEECPACLSPEDVRAQIKCFPEGQFVALAQPEDDEEELVVGTAATMRVSRPPTEPPLSWMEQIGTLGIARHEAQGEWLYGVEMAVRPSFRRRGIGRALYQARFELVKRLNLRGWYAGGALIGYQRYRSRMSIQEYAEKVQRNELIDPTVTMQMHRGFQACGIIEDYMPQPESNNAAMLIVWHNPNYQAEPDL